MGPLAIALAALGGSSLLARLRTGSWNPLGLLRGAAAPPPPAPNPPLPASAPPSPAPAVRPFSRLDVATSAARAPGDHVFTLSVGDVVSIEGTASDFTMSSPPGMLRRLDGSEGLGSVGLNDFQVLSPGTLQIAYQGGSATVLAVAPSATISGRAAPLSPGRLDVEVPMPPQRLTNIVLP